MVASQYIRLAVQSNDGSSEWRAWLTLPINMDYRCFGIITHGFDDLCVILALIRTLSDISHGYISHTLSVISTVHQKSLRHQQWIILIIVVPPPFREIPF